MRSRQKLPVVRRGAITTAPHDDADETQHLYEPTLPIGSAFVNIAYSLPVPSGKMLLRLVHFPQNGSFGNIFI